MWHKKCWDAYREESNYRGAADRREGKHQRCVKCKRFNGQLVRIDGKVVTIKVERDHIVSLALNGPRAWTGARCQLCHQEKSTEDNARVKDWRARDPRPRSARRAPRGNRRASMANTPSARARSSSNQRAQRAGALDTIVRVVLALAFIGVALVMFFDWWDEVGALAAAIGRSALPYAIATGAVALAVLVLVVWLRLRKRARWEAIYRLTNAISQEARVAPDVIRIRPRRWRHGIPVRGSAYYGETVDDQPGSETREKVERIIQHKLGLNLVFEWQHWRDTVYWRPAPIEAPQRAHPDLDAADEPEPADEPSGKTELVQQRVEEKVRSLIKSKDGVDFTWGNADAIGPLRFKVAYPSAYNDESDDTRQALVDGVNSKAPGRWRATWNTEENRVEFERRPPMPTNIAIPVEASNDTWRLPFGTDEHGDQVVWDMKLHPHALIAGGTGSGKTVTLRALIQAAVARGFVVICIDPKRIEMAGLRGWPGVRVVATGTTHMIAAVTLLADIMDDRYKAIEDGDVDENDLPPVLVVIDEAREFIDRANAHWKANKTGSGQEHPVIERWRSMARLGRSGRIHLLVGIQRPDAKVIGGEARDNYGFRVALGSMSPEGAKMMFGRTDIGRDIPEDAKGRATVAIGNDFREVQGYNTPDPRKDRTPGAIKLLGQLRKLADEHASNALANITPELIEEIAEEIGGRAPGRRSFAPRRETATGKPSISSPTRRKQDRQQDASNWEPTKIGDLEDGDTVRLMIDGEPTEVQIIGLDESPDSDDLAEVTYRLADGTESVIAVEYDEQVSRRVN